MGGKEEKETEEEYQASFTPKIKFREGTWYLWGKPGHTLPDFTKAASTPKNKWAFKILESSVSLFPIKFNRLEQEYYFRPNTRPNLKY